MGIPVKPDTPIQGQLRLTVVSPDTKLEIITSPDETEKNSLDSLINLNQFKLPPSFAISTSMDELINRNKEDIRVKIEHLINKYKSCVACRRNNLINVKVLTNTLTCLDKVYSTLRNSSIDVLLELKSGARDKISLESKPPENVIIDISDTEIILSHSVSGLSEVIRLNIDSFLQKNIILRK